MRRRHQDEDATVMAERGAGGSGAEGQRPAADLGDQGREGQRPVADRDDHGRDDQGREGHGRDGHGRRGNEFEGVLGLLAGWTMGIGRGRSTRLIVELAEVSQGDRVVDVGCGPGRFLQAAAERGATAVGVDPSSQMRRLALRRVPERLRAAITVTEGTAEELPLEDGSATVAWAVASFHHWSDPDAGLAEMHRVLEPGGRLVVAEGLARPRRCLKHHALTWEAAERLAARTRQTGFTDVTVARHSLGRRQLVVVRGRRPTRVP
jgi:SAM-dependent methyltransferase